MTIAISVLETIGNTPMMELTKLDAGPCRLFVKLENQNPGGSVKDRIGLAMIEAAERDGLIQPGGTIIEATAGNTGLGLALVAAQKGYRMILVIPDKMSHDKVLHLKALGAEVILTRSDVPKGHPDYYQDMAERIHKETPNSFWVDQFSNPANTAAHELGTGPEIWQQMDGKVDAFVAGVGSGGTISGIGRYLKSVSPTVKIVAADPVGSVIANAVKTGEVVYDGGSWLVEGIGEDFIPPILDLSVIDDAEMVSDTEAFEATRDLLRIEGILGGSSTGTLLAGALKWCRQQTEPKNVVTLVCDTGNKYLSKAFNQSWLVDNGLINRAKKGDISDLIIRRYDQDEMVSVTQHHTVMTAYSRMRVGDVSQLPVIHNNQLVGIIDEEDIMLAAFKQPDIFESQVSEIMISSLDTLPSTASENQLMGLLSQNKVAIIMDEDQFLGFITKIDLVNHLRQQYC